MLLLNAHSLSITQWKLFVEDSLKVSRAGSYHGSRLVDEQDRRPRLELGGYNPWRLLRTRDGTVQPEPGNTYSRRWMGFVDGENLTIRGQKFLEGCGLNLGVANPALYERNTFLWLPGRYGGDMIVDPTALPEHMQLYSIRSYYYTTVVGDAPKVQSVREALWKLVFQPEVFTKKKQQEKTKGVDIALAKDMLSNAYFGNYEVALLYAGDGDYVPLVEEVKRMGKLVYTLFFKEWTHDELRLSSDGFIDLEPVFYELWRRQVPQKPPNA